MKVLLFLFFEGLCAALIWFFTKDATDPGFSTIATSPQNLALYAVVPALILTGGVLSLGGNKKLTAHTTTNINNQSVCTRCKGSGREAPQRVGGYDAQTGLPETSTPAVCYRCKGTLVEP